MPRSIRWRLQAWYGLVLLAVVAGFAGILYERVHAARDQEIDASLRSAAQYLDANLRHFPPHELRGGPPPLGPEWYDRTPGPHPPPDERRPPPPPPRRPLDRQRLLAELDLPRRPGSPAPENDPEPVYFAIWRADGAAIKSSHLPPGADHEVLADVPLSPQPQLRQRGEYREAVLGGPAGTRILVGQSMRGERARLLAFAGQLAAAGVIALAVGLAGGWLVSARILRPLAAISATAQTISATNLTQRIDAATVDRELADLAGVLNATFDRLQAAFERQSRFTADASHELRTPLAIVRSHAELALSRPRSEAEYRTALDACLRAAGRMTGLVDGLLTLARADAGRLDLQPKVIDLQPVVQESLTLLGPMAQARMVRLSAHLASANVAGDALCLGQVVTNLLSNAIQYNRPGGEVVVSLQAAAAAVSLSVRDTGCGIPPEDVPHIFERFYRVDKARSRSAGGNGLGLAICKSIVEAHGGTIGVETMTGQGSTFWVRLPAPVSLDRAASRR